MKIKESILRWKRVLKNVKSYDSKFRQTTENFETLCFEKYKHLADKASYKQSFRLQEFQIYSQNGEDGLILFIFDQIGVTNRKFVEFGSSHGRQCNTANLAINYNWSGLLMDGDDSNIIKAREFYANYDDAYPKRLQIEKHFITAENINEIFRKHKVPKEIDLLSIDIDGNDYWVWKAISTINPRVVVIEYNSSLGKSKDLIVKYDETFERYSKHSSGWYHGASVVALNNLAEQKGYSLVGCDSEGVNMFFVRKDQIKGQLQTIDPTEAYYSSKHRLAKMSLQDQYNLIKSMPYTSSITKNEHSN